MLGSGYRLSRDDTERITVHETQGAARAMNTRDRLKQILLENKDSFEIDENGFVRTKPFAVINALKNLGSGSNKTLEQQRDVLLERLRANESERKYIEECLRELINRHNLNKEKL